MEGTNNQMPGASPVASQTSPEPHITMIDSPVPHKNKTLVSILVVLIVVILGGLGYYYYEHNKKYPDLSAVTKAPDGALVSGFPRQLIIVNDASITSSKKTVITSRASNLFSTEYTTKSPITGLFTAYIDYMNNNGYTIAKSNILNGQATISGSRIIAKQLENISISIVDQNGISKVDIAINTNIR